jgi:hypothetical protein
VLRPLPELFSRHDRCRHAGQERLAEKNTQTKNELPTGGRSVFLSDFFDGLLITDGSEFGASPVNRSLGVY